MHYAHRPFLPKPILFLLAFLFTLSLAAQEQYKAMKFDGTKNIVFGAKSSLNLGDEGTIELIFHVSNANKPDTEDQADIVPPTPTRTSGRRRAMDILFGRRNAERRRATTRQTAAVQNTDTIGTQALIAHANGRSTHFAVYLNESATRIGLYDGNRFKSAVFNFNDGKYHHVALATKSGKTAVIIDHQVIDTLDVGYGQMVDGPVVVGSSGKGRLPFIGHLLTLRIWQAALTLADIDQLKIYGQPPVSSARYPDLVVFSHFSSTKKSIYYAHPPVLRSNLIGMQADTTITDRLKPGERYTSIIFKGSTGCTDDIELHKAIGSEATDTVDFAGTNNIKTPDTIVFQNNEFLTGISATNSGGCLKSIRFISNLETYSLGRLPADNRWESSGNLIRLPPGALLVGVEAEISRSGNSAQVFGFRLLYTMNGEYGLADGGNWGPDAQTIPVRDDDVARRLGNVNETDGGLHLHGNYTATPVINLRFDLLRDSLFLLIDLPARAIAPDSFEYAEILPPFTFTIDSIHNCYSSLDRNVKLTFLNQESFQLEVNNDTIFPLSPDVYNYQGSYPTAGKDKLEWGGTFTLNQRPTLLDFNFRGYNLTRVNPFNYQVSTGTDKFVFQMPADDSHEYNYTTADKIIPYGLYFANDRESISRAKSTTVTSSKDHQSSWAVNLGMSLGVAGMALSQSGAFQHSSATMRSTKQLHTTSMAHEVKYALVLDRSRMRLDPNFRAAVLRMRDQLLIYGSHASGAKPGYRNFIETYGTHYPYAVTYGGMAYQNTAISDSIMTSSISNGVDLERNASASLEGVTLGSSAGVSASAGNTTGNSFEEERKTVYTVGGDISFGASGTGWNLPNGDEVPVLLDLRMISELLSPLYFDDPFIWTELREGLKNNLIAYDAENNVSDNPWVNVPSLQRIEVQILSFDNPNSQDLDESGEWVSSLTLGPDTKSTSPIPFNTTADGLEDDTSLLLNQTLNFYKTLSEDEVITMSFSGNVTDLDDVGANDVCIPAGSTGTFTIENDPTAGDWSTNQFLSLSDNASTPSSGTITYRYRMIPVTPRTDPE